MSDTDKAIGIDKLIQAAIEIRTEINLLEDAVDGGEIQWTEAMTEPVNKLVVALNLYQLDDTFNDDTEAQTFSELGRAIILERAKDLPTHIKDRILAELNAGKMRLIGIHGPARAGKDTLASYLLDNLSDDWSRSSFAGPIKAMIEVITGEVKDEDKDKVDPRFGVTVRYLYQTIGTDWGRDMVGGDIWVGAFSRLNAGEQLVVPDVRFENEAELVRANGVLIHLVGRGGIEGNHVSENAIEFKPGDIVIDNSRDLAWLHGQVDGNAVLGEFIAEVGE